jgi:hypothetical protein
MQKKEIMEVVAAWYDIDPSYHAAKALFDHGVGSDCLFDMKDDYDKLERRTRWYMVWTRLKELEHARDKGNTVKPANHPPFTYTGGRGGVAPREESEDVHSTLPDDLGDLIL